jgi:mannose-6-phosphate isomerase-like protein (cupin superfamily)
MRVVNLAECFDRFTETFTPKIVGELNGQHVKVAHLEGDKVPWHTHDGQDELFWVIDGVLDVLARDESVTVHAGELCIVPRGLEHRVVPRAHVRLVLFEPAGIAHTGDVRAEITKDRFDWLE